ncbi:MAG: helix-hairpin-helix domain-containing protein [Phycicoccus sp.]
MARSESTAEGGSTAWDRGPTFDGVRIGRPAVGALIDAGYSRLHDLPEDLGELRGIHGVGRRAVETLRQARDH